MELFANNASTTLNGGISAGATSLTVASATLFPAVGSFRLLIDSELVLVTAVAGAVFTVTRGIEGTTAASHLGGATVTQVVTVGGLNQAINQFVFGTTFTPPIDANYFWVNQGAASTTTDGTTVTLNVPASGAKSNILRVQAAPAPPYTITALFRGNPDPTDYWNMGLCFRESSSGKHHTFGITQVGVPLLGSSKFTDPNTFSADYRTAGLNLLPWTGNMLLRIADNGTNRICSFSVDGVNWQVFHTVSRTDFLTANQVGFWANSQNSVAFKMALYHWLQG